MLLKKVTNRRNYEAETCSQEIELTSLFQWFMAEPIHRIRHLF